MPKKKTRLDRFSDLTWNDMEEWAGGKIVSRGKSYQRQGRVSDLAVTDDGGLIAWVAGTERYATKVVMDDDGLAVSNCTCPYEFDCKHGVAIVLEYLERVENNRRVSKVSKNDERLELLKEKDWDDEADDDENVLSEDIKAEIDAFLKGKTKVQLVELIHKIAEQYPEIAQDLTDRRQLTSGDTKSLVTRLRNEIWEIGEEPGWQNYWRHEGYTPDYSSVRKKINTLMEAGCADEVIAISEELMDVGSRQVGASHDEGETAMEIAACVPLIVRALAKSSMAVADKMAFAVDAVLEDEYSVFDGIAEYLMRKHKKEDWGLLADKLLGRLKTFKSSKKKGDYDRRYRRDQLSNWAIHALERADRKEEVIPLCKAEVKKTGSYDRLVKRLIDARCYEDAEHWIQEGIRTFGKQWPGIAASLRGKLLEIRTVQKNWPVVAAIKADEFVRQPSSVLFTECKKVVGKVRVWPKVRECLLAYLKKAVFPWKQKNWPLPVSGLDEPDAINRTRFPMIDTLIDIAILEKKPDQVLYWYDRRPKQRFGWHGPNEDRIATAVRHHAPERAIAIWKKKAEDLIALVKPRAYQEAAQYLRKASKVMVRQKKQKEWSQYLQELREKHARKRRLIEILDGLDGKPILKKGR